MFFASARKSFRSILLILLFFAPLRQLSAVINDLSLTPMPDIKTFNLDDKKVLLGKILFEGTQFSASGKYSCASCHALDKFGADGRDFSLELSGKIRNINTPSVFNSALNFRQFWDGRALDLQEQISDTIAHEFETKRSWSEIIYILSTDSAFKKQFRNSYADGISEKNIKDALAQYIKSLVTPSRFDRFLKNEQNSLSNAENEGFLTFKKYGCIACHQGVNFGGNMLQQMGIFRDYFIDDNNMTKSTIDLGRFLITKNPNDKHVFKVPSLRNVALTAPYFHNASAKTLEEAIRVMFVYQLGLQPSLKDIQSIKIFLNALSGEQLEKEQL